MSRLAIYNFKTISVINKNDRFRSIAELSEVSLYPEGLDAYLMGISPIKTAGEFNFTVTQMLYSLNIPSNQSPSEDIRRRCNQLVGEMLFRTIVAGEMPSEEITKLLAGKEATALVTNLHLFLTTLPENTQEEIERKAELLVSSQIDISKKDTHERHLLSEFFAAAKFVPNTAQRQSVNAFFENACKINPYAKKLHDTFIEKQALFSSKEIPSLATIELPPKSNVDSIPDAKSFNARLTTGTHYQNHGKELLEGLANGSISIDMARELGKQGKDSSLSIEDHKKAVFNYLMNDDADWTDPSIEIPTLNSPHPDEAKQALLENTSADLRGLYRAYLIARACSNDPNDPLAVFMGVPREWSVGKSSKMKELEHKLERKGLTSFSAYRFLLFVYTLNNGKYEDRTKICTNMHEFYQQQKAKLLAVRDTCIVAVPAGTAVQKPIKTQ